MSSDPTSIEGFELSPQQARLWRWREAHLAASCRMAQLQFRAPRGTTEARLRESLTRVIERHEILRTQYQQIPGVALPVQVIEAGADALILSCKPSSDGSLLVSLQLPSLHADATSLYQLAAEWASAYLNKSPGDTPLQYADYAAWRSELIGSDPNAQTFWEQERSSITWPTSLPLRGQGFSAPPIHLEALPLTLSPSLLSRWVNQKEASDTQHALRALTAWMTLLHQHSEAERMTLGLDWQVRGDHLGGAIGLFSEPMPLTLEALSGHTTETLYQQIGHRSAALHEWRDYFPSPSQEEPPALGFRYLPLIEAAARNATDWEIEQAHCPGSPSRLLLEHRATTKGPALTLYYDRSLYSASAAALLGEQLIALLEAGFIQPNERLQALSALSPAEQQRINETLCRSAALPVEKEESYQQTIASPNLVAYLAQVSHKNPTAIALQSANGQLSYAALEARASSIAQTLLARGVTPGARVVHFFPRNLDAIAAMLAILKVGGVYIPIDPSYPTGRIDFQITDCGAEAILTQRSLRSRLPDAQQESGRVVFVEDAKESDQPPIIKEPSPESIAYLIYTSGSTGAPKGVPISHASALHSLGARIAYYPEPVRHFLLLSSFAFDSSLAGIFWTLAQSGCLYLCSEDEQRDPDTLAKLICTHETTHLLALPSLYQLLLSQLAGRPNALKIIIVAGESCPKALVEAHHRDLPAVRLYNEYGPTEAAVWSTVAECAATALPVSIGRPIPGSMVYLLDSDRRPVARGLKGEIYIAGPGLSPGYLHRPELTAERFLQLRETRVYRTGDYAYRDERGELVFVGRADEQIKIRGYRVELGEIEAALRRVSGAEQVAVLAERSEDGQLSLRAFVEAATPQDIEATRRGLSALLPAFMLPSALQTLPRLPRTANGKLDRNALLALKPRQQRALYVAPRDHPERILAAIWEKLLSVEFIGRDDDFFALGGHSLLVVRLVHHIKEALHREIPVSEVFERKTLAALAQSINSDAPSLTLIPLRQGAKESAALFCVHQPSGGVHHYLPLIEKLPAAQTVYGVPLPRGRSPENATLYDLAKEYLGHLRTRQPHGPYLLCGWSMGGLIALELAHQLEQQNETVSLLALFDTTLYAEDEALAVTELIAALRAELTPESAPLLEALEQDTLDSLGEATAQLTRVAQLRHLLLTWAPQQNLRLKAPTEVIEATLEAMHNARLWVSQYKPQVVAANLHLWWAEETLTQNQELPAAWRSLSAGAARHYTVPGNHDDILRRPELHTSFNEALAVARKDPR